MILGVDRQPEQAVMTGLIETKGVLDASVVQL